MSKIGPVVSMHGLDRHGLSGLGTEYWNLSTPHLVEEAVRRGEGHLAHRGPFVVSTGAYTGRSPNDRFIVRDATTESDVNWGSVNKAITPEQFDRLHKRIAAHLEGRDVFVQDCYCGADPTYRLPVRVVTEHAWHAHFARNMFIQPRVEELPDFEPGFTVLQAPGCHADPAEDGVNSEVFVVLDFTRRLVLIGGSAYAGEIKKSVFSVMNFVLPAQGVLPMHCSANVGPRGDTAIFFGLSGTGKTTLSADPERVLIGDDEHGWGPTGVFNFEGGCYAKVIRLNPEMEPEIYATTRSFETVLENVVMDPDTRRLDLNDDTLTENTRASYPISQIPNAKADGRGGQPKSIIMLTADAFGVLPPISRLSPEQAMVHFLCGYTAKVAGTERGVKEPQATFSTCFGGPFMPRHPSVYGQMLADLIRRHGATCWLVNTGWTGGAYGVGQRMPISHTRSMVNAALDGMLDRVTMRIDPNFGLEVPTVCPGVPSSVLDPRSTWSDPAAYDAAAASVVERFRSNFAQYLAYVDEPVKVAAEMKSAA